ncbi:hypothetical protein BGX29_004046 [Mortierella sp. GBA35]|nr:hypothetical protein BGX29_004046 [Mortierella sp. GBA35]
MPSSSSPEVKTPKRSVRQNRETTSAWNAFKKYYEDDLKMVDKVNAVLAYFANKFNDEPHLTTQDKQDLLNELRPLVAEGLDLIDMSEKQGTSLRGKITTEYLDRLQAVLESRND